MNGSRLEVDDGTESNNRWEAKQDKDFKEVSKATGVVKRLRINA